MGRKKRERWQCGDTQAAQRGAAWRGAESPKMQCAALERRRRRRAWRITDLASSGSAAPDTPSTTVTLPTSSPIRPFLFVNPLPRAAPRRRRPGTAQPHALPDCSFRIRLSSSFIIRHCRRRPSLPHCISRSRYLAVQSAELPQAAYKAPP